MQCVITVGAPKIRDGVINRLPVNVFKQIRIYKSPINFSYLMYIELHSHIIISLYLCPKVIPLSSFHCNIDFVGLWTYSPNKFMKEGQNTLKIT